MRLPANHKTLLRESAGASFLLLGHDGVIRRWWPAESLTQAAPPEATAAAIKAVRVANGWTLEDIGERMGGAGKSAVHNWEKGIRQPSTAAMRLLYIELQRLALAEIPGPWPRKPNDEDEE